MKWNRKLGWLVCVCLFAACSEKKTASLECYNVEVDFHEEPYMTSSFLDKFQLIPLGTPSRESVISHIERLLFADDRIFVVDRISNKVLAFDNHGTFVASTERLIGKGHNEYVRMIDAGVDEESRKLYVHCDAPYQMIVLDFDLNVEKVIPMDYYIREMAVDNEWVYGLRRNSKGDSGYEIVATRKDSLNQPPQILYSTSVEVRGRMTMGKSLTSGGGSIFVSIPFDNKLLKIKDGGIVRTYAIDFGDKGLSKHPIDEDMSPDFFSRHYRDIYWSIVNISGADSLLLFNTNKITQFILNQKTNECHGYERIRQDKLPFSTSYITPSCGLKNGVAYEIDAKIASKFFGQMEETGTNMETMSTNTIRQLDPDGNPLIIVATFK